jgi:hypothetical protein
VGGSFSTGLSNSSVGIAGSSEGIKTFVGSIGNGSSVRLFLDGIQRIRWLVLRIFHDL